MYAKYIKRPLDFVLALTAFIVLLPVLLVLTVLGAIIMKGNPFFVQPRPGRNERIFHLIKFRTMTCEKDANGSLLPDEKRLTKYGKFLRSTSLDELPELLNIIKGDMAIVGPRPLLVEYLPYYTEQERRRHDIRPGLTGLAQVNGRNNITWEQKFLYDIEYVNNPSFSSDFKIIILTAKKVLMKNDIVVGKDYTMGKFIEQREGNKVSNEHMYSK